jgi:hypothetical protein
MLQVGAMKAEEESAFPSSESFFLVMRKQQIESV